MLDGWALSGVAQGFSGGRYGPTPLHDGEMKALAGVEGQSLMHADMPMAVRLELPDWVFPLLAARFGNELDAEMAALEGRGALDMRVNLLKGTLADAQAALTAEGIAAEATPLSPWGLRVAGRRPVSTGKAFQAASSKSRTKAASWSQPSSAPSPRCAWSTGAPAPAARRWRWP